MHMVLEESDPQYQMFEAQPPRRAVVRVVGGAGQVAFLDTLARPLARVQAARLHGPHQSLLVTVDYSIGMGSYAGPLTSILEQRAGRYRWATNPTVPQRSGKRIMLPNTIKAQWQIQPTAGRSGEHDILVFACEPDWSGRSDEFTLKYQRYHFDGQRWRGYVRTQPGFWEAESDFPPESRFPRVPLPPAHPQKVSAKPTPKRIR